MSWFPIGPDFVYTPRDTMMSPQRISRRNMYARQTQVWNIAVDPNDPNTLYTVDQDKYILPVVKGGAVGHRTDDGGKSWTSITDSLQQADFTFTPTCFAVHPLNSNYVYMGTNTGAFYVSSNKGQQWGAPVTVTNGPIGQIVVDPRNAMNPSTTTIYVGTGNGLFVSTTGGASFGGSPTLAGTISSLAFSLLLGGADCYAGVFQQGIHYSTNPTSNASWAAATGNGLPAIGTYDHVWLQYCPVNPQRAYCYFASYSVGTVALCTTGKGATNWSKINSAGIPTSSGIFAVAPNSPGNGQHDILFLGHLLLSRSTDSGSTWVAGADAYHVDQRSFAFNPPNPPMGTIPTMLVGNDGGLIGSTGYADPNYAYGTAPTDFDDGATYNASSGVAQNLNQGKISAALHAYNADPSASSIGYIVCDDTGLAGHSSALGWRGLGNGDDIAVACTPGTDGVKVWACIGYPYQTKIITDQGVSGDNYGSPCTLNGSGFASSSNHVLSLGKTCIAGSVTNPAANPPSGPIVDIDQAGIATQISQVFAPTAKVVAASPVDNLHLACVTRTDDTGANDHLFVTSGVPLNANTMWSEATTNLPAGIIASVAIDHSGTVYALMQSAVNGTPLYSIANNAWTAITCTGLPGLPYGKLVADPVTNGTLYAVSGGRVFRIVVNGNNAAWTEVGSGLPGPHVEDLWVGQIPKSKVLLRATIAARGVWEHDVTLNAVDPTARPYLRDHLLDQGWVAPSPDGLVNPYRPTDGISVYHYQSADIKVDAQQMGPPAFFQTDPEGTLPLSHVLFDVMTDNSESLPGSDAAMVHVQVHNRSYTPLNTVSVWAIYATASAGVPWLNTDAQSNNNFLFWNQFQANGTIVPNLPGDSPWTSVGAPIVLNGIDALHPQVASWNWTVPPYVSGDPGHYCMVAFVHSAKNPIGETTNYIVDVLAHENPQIGQKNLHITTPLPAGPLPPPPWRWTRQMREYIEFHAAGPEKRPADLVFDLRPLPPQLQMWLRFSELATQAPLEQSLVGIETIHHPGLADHVKAVLLAGVERADELVDWFDRWLDRFEDKLDGGHRPDRPRHKPHPQLRFTKPIYRAKPASLVAVRGVELAPHGAAAALMVIENHGELPQGSEYRFQVQQFVGGRLVGGSTYVIRIAGPARIEPLGAEELCY
jgi:photosystem II stability/assembly factor-like uncharacterized protein